MKNFSVCLLVLASCSTVFAGCSASDDSGGTGGAGGTSIAGQAGANAVGGTAGEAGESAGGQANGSGGASDQAGAGGVISSAGTAGATGGDTSTDPLPDCFGAAQTVYANGIVAYFNAHIPGSACMFTQDHGFGDGATEECGNTFCGGGPGCSASFTWHNASYDDSTQTFSVQVDIAATLSVTGAATCSLSDSVTSLTIKAPILVVNNETSLDTSVTGLQRLGGTPSHSGCDTLSNADDIATSDMAFISDVAEDTVLNTLNTYSVPCSTPPFGVVNFP